MSKLVMGLVLGAALTASGGCGLLWNLRELWRARASRRWIVGEAEIVSATLRESRGRGGEPEFKPIVSFRYQHEGREYIGTRVAFGYYQPCDRRSADQFIAHFAPGTRRQVNICPTRPQLSVLEPGLQYNIWAWLIVSFVGVIVGGNIILEMLVQLFPQSLE
jgi:hypothetical protein